METRVLLPSLLKAFKLKLVSDTPPREQDKMGSVTFVCRAAMSGLPTVDSVRRALATGNYGKGVNVVDMEVATTPIKVLPGAKGVFISVFLVLNKDDDTSQFSISYTSVGDCIHVTPLYQ